MKKQKKDVWSNTRFHLFLGGEVENLFFFGGFETKIVMGSWWSKEEPQQDPNQAFPDLFSYLLSLVIHKVWIVGRDEKLSCIPQFIVPRECRGDEASFLQFKRHFMKMIDTAVEVKCLVEENKAPWEQQVQKYVESSESNWFRMGDRVGNFRNIRIPLQQAIYPLMQHRNSETARNLYQMMECMMCPAVFDAAYAKEDGPPILLRSLVEVNGWCELLFMVRKEFELNPSEQIFDEPLQDLRDQSKKRKSFIPLPHPLLNIRESQLFPSNPLRTDRVLEEIQRLFSTFHKRSLFTNYMADVFQRLENISSAEGSSTGNYTPLHESIEVILKTRELFLAGRRSDPDVRHLYRSIKEIPIFPSRGKRNAPSRLEGAPKTKRSKKQNVLSVTVFPGATTMLNSLVPMEFESAGMFENEQTQTFFALCLRGVVDGRRQEICDRIPAIELFQEMVDFYLQVVQGLLRDNLYVLWIQTANDLYREFDSQSPRHEVHHFFNAVGKVIQFFDLTNVLTAEDLELFMKELDPSIHALVRTILYPMNPDPDVLRKNTSAISAMTIAYFLHTLVLVPWRPDVLLEHVRTTMCPSEDEWNAVAEQIEEPGLRQKLFQEGKKRSFSSLPAVWRCFQETHMDSSIVFSNVTHTLTDAQAKKYIRNDLFFAMVAESLLLHRVCHVNCVPNSMERSTGERSLNLPLE